jgi:DNA-binding transcriptional ArsR family regulator
MVKEVSQFSFSRALILSVIAKHEKENLSKEDIAKLSKMSRASVYHHLKELKEMGLILATPCTEKKLGHPFIITTDKANANWLKGMEIFRMIFPKLFEDKEE